ncbi:MAG: LysM peptidoglycan-binding domain-containing protein [Lachnospiraceae bacterium]|nr:LysM peptidoglycan-binding domain-containing protein [Lachnospiraceae bacterium]
MKSIKRGLAVFLAMLLIMPALPVSAENLPDDKVIAADMTGEGDKTPDTEETENNQEDTPTDAEPTDAPEESQTPEPVESPEATQAPEETSSPDATDAPEASPEATDEPEATASPEETAVPDATASPEETASPEADATPSGTPEETTAPTASVAPTAAVTPTGTPQATPTATASSTPGVTPTATASATPSATPTATPSATPSATPTATPSATPSLEDIEIDEVCFNTGNHVWSVVNQEAFELGAGDVSFEEDGNYTINIPEENPFFPYEVQFTYEDEVTNEWFMTPDDSVEIGGHTFYVSAHFDGTAVTRMSLNVAGDTVIVWPEEKEFTDDGNGELLTSLLPLRERYLRVDLSAYTPAELTMVSPSEIFTGENQLTDTDKIVWTKSGDDYTVSSSGDRLDLSVSTYYSSSSSWEMIVGEADQLAADNIRYQVNCTITPSEDWLISTVYTQDGEGNRKSIFVGESEYYDYRKEDRRLRVEASSPEMGEEKQAYVNLNINPTVFENTRFNYFKIYEGKFGSAEEAMTGTNITDQICCEDMTQINAGYRIEERKSYELTMVTFDMSGNATGCLQFQLYLYPSGNKISSGSVFERTEYGRNYVADRYSSVTVDGCWNETAILKKGYPVDGIYYQTVSYYRSGANCTSEVTAAYVGRYSSITDAISKGAEDVKGSLLNTDYRTEGYGADYSKGVYFTIFVGEDGTDDQEIYYYCFKTVPYEPGQSTPGKGTNVYFYGLVNSEKERIKSFVTPNDSYGENSCVTILVGPDTDLTNLAPVFSLDKGATLHVDGSSVAEVSGVSYHDFSKGPVHYGVSSEDKNNSRNCWLKVMKAESGAGQLYINSLEDENSNTRVENGVTYSMREMLLDGYHNYRHDILVINKGESSIPALEVELSSDVVQLDEYWTLSGNHDLSGFAATESELGNEHQSNLAKLRLSAKDGVADGSDVSGTLTFKSGGTVLMVLNLTGTIGDPCITTDEIPQAVRYVPYGPLILNNNKYYSWNKVRYSLEDGVLPVGMEVKPNGEIYGVPTETGEFTFTVRMDNSYSGFKSSLKTYTMTVLENTDTNVDNSTDEGYDVTQRIQNIYITSGSPDLSEERRTFVSQGEYNEFKYVFLDGVKLTEGQEYTSESGSTRITIMWETLLSGSASTPGTHTLGVEFRNGEDEILKRAAQNFVVEREDGGDSGNDSGSSDAGGGSDGNSDSGNAGTAAGGTGTGGLKGTKTAANGIAGASAGAGVTGPASAVSYTVESGDTLWKIAEKFYGDGSYWQKIFAENAAVIGSDPNRIYAGQILTIYLNQGDGSVMTAMPAEGMEGIEGNYYIVQEGDTLWKIALKIYNRGWRWRRIYEANVNSIPDPQNIYVGQVLLIPD